MPAALIDDVVGEAFGWKRAKGEREVVVPQTIMVVVLTEVVTFIHAPF